MPILLLVMALNHQLLPSARVSYNIELFMADLTTVSKAMPSIGAFSHAVSCSVISDDMMPGVQTMKLRMR